MMHINLNKFIGCPPPILRHQSLLVMFHCFRDNRGSYSGRSSRDSASGGGHSRRPQGEVITEDRASNVLQGAADTDREKLEDKTRTIIDEYLQVHIFTSM